MNAQADRLTGEDPRTALTVLEVESGSNEFEGAVGLNACSYGNNGGSGGACSTGS